MVVSDALLGIAAGGNDPFRSKLIYRRLGKENQNRPMGNLEKEPTARGMIGITPTRKAIGWELPRLLIRRNGRKEHREVHNPHLRL